MTTYMCKWNSGDEDTFSVGEEAERPAKWNCSYLAHNGPHNPGIWYWVDLPNYMRPDEVVNRDLSCVAVGMTCELLSYAKGEEKPRMPELIELAVNIEKSRAILAGRKPRELLEIR